VSYAREVVVSPSTPSVRLLSDADVYALRAEMYLSHSRDDASRELEALESLRQALRVDPAHVRASVLFGYLQPRIQRAHH